MGLATTLGGWDAGAPSSTPPAHLAQAEATGDVENTPATTGPEPANHVIAATANGGVAPAPRPADPQPGRPVVPNHRNGYAGNMAWWRSTRDAVRRKLGGYPVAQVEAGAPKVQAPAVDLTTYPQAAPWYDGIASPYQPGGF